MNNFELATEATATALNSQGSSMREQAKYADSLEARINRLDTAWNKLTLSAGNAFLTDGLIATVETLNDVAGVTTFMIDKIGVLSGVFGTLGAVTVLLSTRFRTFTTSLIFGTQGMTRAALASAGLSASMTRLGIATVGAKVALQGLLASTLVGAAFVALGFAVEKLISAYSDAKQKQEEFEESQKKNIDALTNNKKQTDELIASYKELSKQKENGQWDTDKEKEYLKIQQQLGDLFPSLISSIDATGQNHLISASAIDKEVESTKKLLELKKEEIKLNAQQVFEDNIDERDGFFGLEKDIERKRNQIQDAIKYGLKDTEVNKLKQELLRMESELATTSLKINDHVLKVAEAYAKLEVDPTIKQSVQDLVSSLDLTDLDPSELESYSMKVANLMDEMQKAYQNQDKSGFEKASNSLKSYVQSMGASDVQASTLGVTFDKVKDNAERLANTTYAGADGMDALSESMDGATASSEDLVKAFDDAVSKIESLNGIINDLNEGKGVSADSISTMIENYPHLLEYLNDEVTLRSKIIEEIDKESKVAKQAVVEKLKYNEAFYINTLKNNQIFVKQMKDMYGIDLTSYKDLNSAKLAVDNMTRERMSKAWETFYANISAAARASTDGMEVMTGALMHRAQSIMAEQTKVSTDFNNIFLEQADILTGASIATSGLSDANSKNAKEYENSIYVSDKFKEALEKVNLELEKQNAIQSKYASHSKQYQNSIKSELKLLDQKKKLLEAQAKALESQIKSGKIQQTGIITSKSASYTPTTSSYASGGSNSATIWNFFKSKGFTDSIVAGIMGNLQLESGLNPNALNKSSGAYGIAQWLGVRKTGLSNYAASIGSSMNDLSTQLNYLWKELNSTEKRTMNFLQGNQGASASTIAAAFDKLFERSEGTHIPQRQQYANQFLSQYAGTGGGTPSKTSTDASKANAERLQGVDQAKSELLQLKSDILGIENEINQLNLLLVQSVVDDAERKINSYRDDFAKIDFWQGVYTEYSDKWRKFESERINHLKHQRGYQKESIAYIKDQIAHNKRLNDAQKAQLRETLIDKEAELHAIQTQINEAEENLINSRLKGFDRSSDSYRDDAARIEYEKSLVKEDSKEWFDLERENIDDMEYQRKYQQQAIAFLEQQIKLNKDLDDAGRERLNQEIITRKTALWNLEKDIFNMKKQTYEKERDLFKKKIDEEMDAYRKAADERLKLIDKEEDARDFNKDLSERQKELQDLQQEIDKYRLDDSMGGKARLADLLKEQAEKQGEFDEFLHDRSVEQRKNAIQDDIDAREETANKQKEDIDKYYDNLIYSDSDQSTLANRTKAIENIMSGHTLSMQNDFNNLASTVNGSMKSIGDSISTNLLEKLGNAKNIIASLAKMNPLGGIVKVPTMTTLPIKNNQTAIAGSTPISINIENLSVAGGKQGVDDFFKYLNNRFSAKGVNTRL